MRTEKEDKKKIVELLRNKTKSRAFVNKFYPITDFIQAGSGLVCCPFHDDSRPSAKIFHDEDGAKLYCFSCNKQYGSSDYLERFHGITAQEFISNKVQENPENITTLAASFNYVGRQAKPFPLEPITKEFLSEKFSATNVALALRKIYQDKERDEYGYPF